MESLRIIPDLEVKGFQDGEYLVKKYIGEIIVGGMANGTEKGNPVVMIGLEGEDHILVAETTLALFLSAADALKTKYGDPRK